MNGIETNGQILRDMTGSQTGTDEHRVETARWVLETFSPETAIHKKALRVLEAYLAGKPLPTRD